jgi:hypothetical protein
MSTTRQPDTILVHSALAGLTLFTRRGAVPWAAYEILPEGNLGDCRPAEADPSSHAWRGASIR